MLRDNTNESIITIQELQQAIAAGAPITVIINGEFYTLLNGLIATATTEDV